MTTRLVIVGGGPLCTYAVERLAALLPSLDPPPSLHITIFDRTGRFGAGATHSDTQAATSYMNRVASQIAFASDESNSAAEHLLPRSLRPTFMEWARAKYEASGDDRFNLRPSEIPRRFLHGEALREMFERYVALLRQTGVTVDLHATEVTDIVPATDGFVVHAGEVSVRADHILLVTGHSTNRIAPGSLAATLNDHGRYIAHAYPLNEQITEESVPPGSSVAVLGLGLTAIDVLLHLTEGRGGRFEEGAYIASGREPATIVGVGPSGLFPSCRPENEKAADPSGASHSALEHKGVFLTIPAIRTLRNSAGVLARINGVKTRQLDFERHVFPLVVLEMACVYYTTLRGKEIAPKIIDAVDERYRSFLANPGDGAIDFLLEPVEGVIGDRFDWRSLFDPLGTGGANWRERLIDYMRRDQRAAAAGNLRDPVKAACDGVWRDLRSVFSEAADFGGLTAQSQRNFAEVYLRYYTRMSNGIGLEAMRKVLALVECGLVDVSIGPAPRVEPVTGTSSFRITGGVTGATRDVDIVIDGRAHPFDVELDSGSLYPNLFRRGLVRRWRNPPDYEPGGLDVTREHHPLQRDGSAERRITILGAPIEGVAFFQLSAGRPRSNSGVLNNVARWANEFTAVLASATRDPVLIDER